MSNRGIQGVFKVVAGDFKVKTSPTQLFLNTSPAIPKTELVNVYPLIKRNVQRFNPW